MLKPLSLSGPLAVNGLLKSVWHPQKMHQPFLRDEMSPQGSQDNYEIY